MSRFLDMLLAAAVRTDRGMTTGEPKAPVRRTWAEVHATALDMAAALQAGTAALPGLTSGSAVGVLAGEPATIAPGRAGRVAHRRQRDDAAPAHRRAPTWPPGPRTPCRSSR